LKESDLPEIDETQPAEKQALGADDIARRRLMEYRQEALACEHSGQTEAEASAVDRSAHLMEQWESEQPITREKILDRVGGEMMTVHEAPPPPIFSKELPSDLLGAHQDLEFKMDLNSDLLKESDPREALQTYLHEYRHAEQFYEAQKSHGIGHESVDPERVLALEDNQKHYIEQPFEDYQNQFVETDARAFAEKTAGEILERRGELQEISRDAVAVGSDGDRMAQRILATEAAGKR